jgi:hypothetical protein
MNEFGITLLLCGASTAIVFAVTYSDKAFANPLARVLRADVRSMALWISCAAALAFVGVLAWDRGDDWGGNVFMVASVAAIVAAAPAAWRITRKLPF